MDGAFFGPHAEQVAECFHLSGPPDGIGPGRFRRAEARPVSEDRRCHAPALACCSHSRSAVAWYHRRPGRQSCNEQLRLTRLPPLSPKPRGCSSSGQIVAARQLVDGLAQGRRIQRDFLDGMISYSAKDYRRAEAMFRRDSGP